jgi:hypothetical protein
MRLSLHRNTHTHPSLRYFIDVDLSQLAVRPGQVILAVHQRPLANPRGVLRELYTTDVAGFRLQAGNLNNVVRLVRELLPALVNYARLPDYVFIARRSKRLYPVYTLGDEVIATTPGGPVFRHVELAKVRSYLGEYVTASGELGRPGQAIRLHVRGVSHRTLALLRPVFYLKKRIPGQTEFWAPVFEAEDGGSIYAYVASSKREVPIDGGYEVLALRDGCAEALRADGRLQDFADLRPDRLWPDYWDRLEATLTAEELILMAGRDATADGIEIALYHNGQLVVAAERRPSEGRMSLFVGQSLEDVRQRVARDYVRRGLLENPGAMRIAWPQSQAATTAPENLLSQQAD